MKSTVWLHIGTPKTGTSAIQVFLGQNATELEAQGFKFPIFPKKFKGAHLERNAHFLSDWANDDAYKEQCINDIIALADSWPNILLSDEELWNSGGHVDSFWINLKERFAAHDIGLKMIVYLRRQDAFAASHWGSKIKIKRRSFTFRQFIDTHEFQTDYAGYLARVSSVLGKENVIARPYEFSQFEGKDNTLISDFLYSLGIEYTDTMVFANDRPNESLGGNVLEVLRHMNRVKIFRAKAWQTLKYFSEIQKEWTKKKKYHDCSTWLGNEREEYMKQFEEINRRVAIEYLGREDGILFKSPLPKNDPEKRHYTYEEMRAILKLLQKKLNKDPNAPFTKEEFQKICDETWEYIQNSTFYVHKHPKFKAIERRIKRLFGIETK